MKKMITIMLSLMMALSLTACSTDTTTASGRLVNVDEDYADAEDTIDITTDYVYVIDGEYYYRSPLLALLPDEDIDYVSQGEDAYAYQVTLADAPEDAFIADADCNEVTDGIFGPDVDTGSDFYIFVPIYAEEETLAVVAKTTTFYRTDEESDTLVEDSISDSVTLTWEAWDDASTPDESSLLYLDTIIASPFYSTAGDGIAYNLFYVDGWGDMYVSVITMGKGGEVAFCVSKKKYFPTEDGIDYTTSDTFIWTTDTGGNTYVTATQAQQIKNTIYNYNFVYPSKLADYGLEGDDMSLYATTSIVIWAIAEGFTPDDLQYKSGMTSSQKAIADKQLALITDMYNNRNTTTTYVSGGRLYNNTAEADAESTYDITSDYVYLIDGTYYYRSPLLSLIPNQLAGYAYSGENAFTYTVTLSDTSNGAFIASANSTNLGTSATIGLDNYYGNRFYVYVPITATSGSLTVNVETTKFSRMDVALWNPTSDSRYQSIVKNTLVEDSASTSVILTWTAYTYE